MKLLRKLLNTLYITNPDIYLLKDGENIVASLNKEVVMRVPIHNLEGIVCFGHSMITPALMYFCSERGVHISLISDTGRFYAKIQSPISGNVRLRRAQYRITDDKEQQLLIAKNFLFGKIFNCRCVLQRLIRDHKDKINETVVVNAVWHLGYSLKMLERSSNLDSLRGIEGEAARHYYGVFNELITQKDSEMVFNGRSRRPPRDEVNAILSFLYTILAHDVEAALEAVGLDPQVGFLHCERPGRSSLALDLMEELRPYIVDRITVSMINNRQLSKADFQYKENGGYLLKPESKKSVLAVWQTRKREEITHPFLKEKIEIGLICYVQALLLARFIRGDIDGYPPFLLR